MKHKQIEKLSLEVKNSINELLREIDIGSPSGIQVPQICMINLGSAYKIYHILKSLSDIDNVVGQPDLPCPVESQNVVSKCRCIAESKDISENDLEFLK